MGTCRHWSQKLLVTWQTQCIVVQTTKSSLGEIGGEHFFRVWDLAYIGAIHHALFSHSHTWVIPANIIAMTNNTFKNATINTSTGIPILTHISNILRCIKANMGQKNWGFFTSFFHMQLFLSETIHGFYTGFPLQNVYLYWYYSYIPSTGFCRQLFL